MSSHVNSPYALRVRDLAHRPGEMREHSLDIEVPDAMGAGVIAVREGAEMRIDLRLEGLHEGVLVSGHASAEAEGECSRCLIDISEPVEVDFAELFAYDASEDFDFFVHDDHVDCEQVVRDAVVLALPFQPVCRPDCPGLDPVTGERLADIGEQRAHEVLDPRWAALGGLTLGDATSGGETPDTASTTTPQTTEGQERSDADQAD
ncbi:MULTISPECIES: YceD family protein [unclassified Curtobacterium]|uniref:YceD family protein n=1 Tax=unclassified Curtobacterium TaxID=257496 RepID=UPI003A8123C4